MSTLRITPKRSSFLYKITTSEGDILANKIVHATNAYLDSLLSISSDIIESTKTSKDTVLVTPTRGHVIEIQPLGDRRFFSLDPLHNITNMSFNNGGEYLIQRPNGNFVLGGGRRFGTGNGYESFSSSRAGQEEIDADVDLYLRSFFTQTLCFDNGRFLSPVSQSKEGNAIYSKQYKIVNQWTGIMGFSTDEIPLVGKVPSFVEQSQEYCIAGFTGHGMPRIFLSAKSLVKQILCEDADFLYDFEYHSSADLSESFIKREVIKDDEVELPTCYEISESRLCTIIASVRGY